MIIGFITRRGFYLSDDLQVFNRGGRGGHYWFSHGWNWRAMGAWVPSALTGLSFVNLPDQFVGPLGQLAGGLDISLPVALTMACALYVALLQCFPEPDAVYGPRGRRWLRGGHGARIAAQLPVELRARRAPVAVDVSPLLDKAPHSAQHGAAPCEAELETQDAA